MRTGSQSCHCAMEGQEIISPGSLNSVLTKVLSGNFLGGFFLTEGETFVVGASGHLGDCSSHLGLQLLHYWA